MSTRVWRSSERGVVSREVDEEERGVVEMEGGGEGVASENWLMTLVRSCSEMAEKSKSKRRCEVWCECVSMETGEGAELDVLEEERGSLGEEFTRLLTHSDKSNTP